MATTTTNRTEVLQVRVRTEEMQRLKQMAEQNDTTVSDYVRRSLRRENRITVEELK